MYCLWLSLFLHPSQPPNGVATSRPRFGYGPALEPRRFQLRGERQRGSVMGSCWEVAPCPARGSGVGCEGFCKHGAGSSPPRLRGSRGQRGRHSLFCPTAPPWTVRGGGGTACTIPGSVGCHRAPVPYLGWHQGAQRGTLGLHMEELEEARTVCRTCCAPTRVPCCPLWGPCGVQRCRDIPPPSQEGAHPHSPHG